MTSCARLDRWLCVCVRDRLYSQWILLLFLPVHFELEEVHTLCYSVCVCVCVCVCDQM